VPAPLRCAGMRLGSVRLMRSRRATVAFVFGLALLALMAAACADAKPPVASSTPSAVINEPTPAGTVAQSSPTPSPTPPFAALPVATPDFAPIAGLTPAPNLTARAPLPLPAGATPAPTFSPSPTPTPTVSPSPSPSPTPSPTPVATPLVPDSTPPSSALQAGEWASVTTRGGCLKVRLSLDPESALLDCLSFGTLVYIDAIQKVGGDSYAHLSGEGFAFPAGLTPTLNPAEQMLPFTLRPHDLGTIAYTTAAGDLWTANGDGSSPLRVVSADQSLGAYYSALAWSHDGSTLLLQREASDGRTIQTYGGSGQPRNIFPPSGVDPATIGIAAWAADSGHVLVSSYDAPGDACAQPANTVSIGLLDLAQGSVRPLFQQFRPGYVASIAASPDGTRAAVLFGASCDATRFDLCLLGLTDNATAGVHAGALDCPGVTVGEVAWSGDGRYLAYTGRLQARDDESQLAADRPLSIYDTRLGSFYPLAYPLRYDSNVIGIAWEADGRTLDIEEEVPRGLADIELPDRVLRRISVDGVRPWAVLKRGDSLLSVRPVLAPGQTHGNYALATGALGELWVIRMDGNDARWQLSPDAIGLAVWSP
jgi:hypothetical protein